MADIKFTTTGFRGICKHRADCKTRQRLKSKEIINNASRRKMTENVVHPDPDAFIKKAKNLVRDTVNQLSLDTGGVADLTVDDFYVVWFAKVLGNWKALVSTDVFHGHYYEVTYNGVKKESYVDTYVKSDNRVAPDADYEEAQQLRNKG
jgi:hypothetical protein